MSEPLNVATKEHVWKFYVKLSDVKAQCIFCEEKYYYINDASSKMHIARKHIKIWTYEEERKLTQWPWRYFKYLDNIYSQCIICDANVSSTIESAENHLTLHSLQQMENNIYQSWSWKYWTRRGNFEAECKICHENLSLAPKSHLNFHIKKKHSDKLQIMQKRYNIVDSSKRVSLLQANTCKSPSIATKKQLWNFFVNLPDFEAQCMFCKNKYRYIEDTDFRTHVAKLHIKIWAYEEERKLTRWPWMHFRYLDNVYSQCIICDANVPSMIESVENHLSSHSLQQFKSNVHRGWSWKYWTQRDDFVVECKICHKNLSLPVKGYLNVHLKRTHSDKLKIMRETHGTTGSSKHVLSRQTDTSHCKSPNIVTKKQLWKYYVTLPDFKAQCIFCKYTINYINYSHFGEHITRQHKEIWKYEGDRKLTKWPWMHFKYLDNLYLQCIICDAYVSSTIESAENHLSLHSEKQRKDHILRNWLWKYCTQKDDFVVRCDICCKNVSLSINHYLNSHIKKTHFDKLKNTQGAHSSVSSSKRVSSLKTDTTSKLILKECYILLKKCSHKDLYV